MATVGFSKPYYAIYSNTGTTVKYSSGGSLGKGVELSVDLDSGEANVLYADNAPAESASSFAGGTITITTDDLLLDAVAAILGMTVDDVSTPTGEEIVFSANTATPYVGLGAIVKKIQGNATVWMAVVYPKIQFQNPGVSATTQGETIEWQTPELTATIMRDDTAEAVWQRWATFNTEADAETYVKNKLGPAGE